MALSMGHLTLIWLKSFTSRLSHQKLRISWLGSPFSICIRWFPSSGSEEIPVLKSIPSSLMDVYSLTHPDKQFLWTGAKLIFSILMDLCKVHILNSYGLVQSSYFQFLWTCAKFIFFNSYGLVQSSYFQFLWTCAKFIFPILMVLCKVHISKSYGLVQSSYFNF